MIGSILLALALAQPVSPARAPRVKQPAPSTKRFVATEPTPEQLAAADDINRWHSDPVSFVREVFGAEPDAWQIDTLNAVARNPKVAMSACKGPGKSCVLGWVAWWFLVTNPDAQIIAVSITGDNLRDGLWKELAHWQSKSSMLQRAFEWGAERIKSFDRPSTWWISARTFAQNADPSQQANTLAGFHAQNILIILDEVGDYPPGVLPAAEAIFANEVNAKLVVAGNPTSTNGPLYTIVTQPTGWIVVFINGDPDDPKRSPRISIKWAQEEIDRWGRDNPYVMVNILGQFPPAGADQLIALNYVVAAMQRDVGALSYRSDPIIWGLDPSRSAKAGADEAALARRQGLLSRKFHYWRGLDGPELAVAVAKMLVEAEKAGELPDQFFIDVGGIGSSVYDHLKLLGWKDIIAPIDFGGSASDSKFLDKRSEMWWLMAEWCRRPGSCLPNDPILRAELVSPNYKYKVVNKRTGFKLQSKEEMKADGIPSPNRADALCLTFAAPVHPKGRHARERDLGGARTTRVIHEYDPLEGA